MFIAELRIDNQGEFFVSAPQDRSAFLKYAIILTANQFLRCRNIPTLSTSEVPVSKKQFIYQSREEIMIVHMREFLALKLPSIPEPSVFQLGKCLFLL